MKWEKQCNYFVNNHLFGSGELDAFSLITFMTICIKPESVCWDLILQIWVHFPLSHSTITFAAWHLGGSDIVLIAFSIEIFNNSSIPCFWY
jgi:hypothetical protein